jgi:hypothetical protein
MIVKQDYDFVIGFVVIIVALFLVPYNLYLAYLSKEIIWILVATMMLFYALFAPVCISRSVDIDRWTLSKWGCSLWSAVVWKFKGLP